MNMDQLSIILLVVLVAIIVWLFFRKNGASNQEGQNLTVVNELKELRRDMEQMTSQQRQENQQRLDLINDRLLKSIGDSSTILQKQFSQTSGIIRDVTERLTKLDETNKQVLNFSEQLRSLEGILKNPKQRGILGEYWLETLLNQVLQPGQYKMQYDLGVDETTNAKLIPDAVIFVKDLVIPIDAKFSLENYNRVSQETDPGRRELLEREFKSDVKKRIDETSKYIRPPQTTDFAFMFVPAEGVYHNLITSSVGAVQVNTKNLIEYAFGKRVMIVSPTSFFAYLQTVLLGLKALKMEESVKEFQRRAEEYSRHMNTYVDHHNRLGKQLETTYRTYTDSSKELRKIDKDIFRITEGKGEKQLEPAEIERPTIE